AAEKLGLSDDEPTSSPNLDLDESRKLITALAGLVSGSAEYLGPQAGVVRDGLQGLQRAFRESSAYPDEPGHGPGEKFTGPVYCPAPLAQRRARAFRAALAAVVEAFFAPGDAPAGAFFPPDFAPRPVAAGASDFFSSDAPVGGKRSARNRP